MARNPDELNARTLEKLIRYHQNLYYNGNPEISDGEFDLLWDRLKEIDSGNKLFTTINSEATDGFPKEYHLIPMGSQEKAANPEAFLLWAKKMTFEDFLVQYKLDGASLELQYENGLFIRAVTRGDGRIGDDITANARKMQGVLPSLVLSSAPGGDHPFSGGIRGEVIMRREILNTFFSDKANCRNAANGLMKRKDGNGCEHLDFICYDAASGKAGNPFTGFSPFHDEKSKLEWLSSQGFTVVPMRICHGASEVIAYRARVMEERVSLSYDIDGLVVKGMETDPADLSRSRPEKQIAFKFNLEEAVTVLREVEWSESGATYTPIAKIDPVQLAGTTVQRANLANPNMISSMNLRIGSRVIVTKRGEIIPKIEALVENPADSQPIIQPAICATCGSALRDEGTRLFCPNPLCTKLIHHRIEKWISVLDIREFGLNLIRRLYDSSRLQSIPDIYTLTAEELAALDRMGEISAAKVLKSLRAKREISLPAFIAGFDIDGIGETMVEKLLDAGLDTIEKLFAASESDFASVSQFGDILAHSLREGLNTLRPEMEKLLAMGAVAILPPLKGGLLEGQSFCFTGELTAMKRTEAEALVKSLGGSSRSSVVKGLSYLVTNDPASGSSKNAKARELGIAIINERDFLALSRGGSAKKKGSQMELSL